MYKLPYFQEQDKGKVLSFMKENSFAVIAAATASYPVMTQVPLEVSEHDGTIILMGHMMRNTDHHKALLQSPAVTVLFTGPHCYVSASWYNNVQTASTWNYISVHAKGQLKFTDEAGTHAALAAVTNQYEGTESPASFNNIPPAYIEKLIPAIVGFTIKIESLENVFKLSQNKTAEEQQTIIQKLESCGDYNSIMIAAEMRQRLE